MDLAELAQRTLQRTWDLHQHIYRLLETHVESVRTRFDPDDYDPWYFTHSVRYEICRSLDSVPEVARWFVRTRHPMSGLELAYREFKFRIWKANGGELPIAGQSNGRELFLRQPFLDHYLDSLGVGEPLPIRLILSWETDRLLHLGNVELVCPKDYDSQWKPGEDWFRIPVPHPVAQIVAPTQFTQEPTELEIELERAKMASQDDPDTES